MLIEIVPRTYTTWWENPGANIWMLGIPLSPKCAASISQTAGNQIWTNDQGTCPETQVKAGECPIFTRSDGMLAWRCIWGTLDSYQACSSVRERRPQITVWAESNVQRLERRQPSGRTAELLLVLWAVMMKVLLPEGFSAPSESFSSFRLYLRSELWPRRRVNSCVTEPARVSSALPADSQWHLLCWGAQSGPQGTEGSLITGSSWGNWTWFVHF